MSAYLIDILKELLTAYWCSPAQQLPLLFSYFVILTISFKPSLPMKLLNFLKTKKETKSLLIIWLPIILCVIYAIFKIWYYVLQFGADAHGTDTYVQIISARLILNGQNPYAPNAQVPGHPCIYPPLYMLLTVFPLLIYDHAVGIYVIRFVSVFIALFLSIKLADKILKDKNYVLAYGLTLLMIPLFWKGIDRNFNSVVVIGLLFAILLFYSAVEKFKINDFRNAKKILTITGIATGIAASIRYPVFIPFFALVMFFPYISMKHKFYSFAISLLTFGIINFIYYLIFGWYVIYYSYLWITDAIGCLSWMGMLLEIGVDINNIGILQKFLLIFLIALPILYLYLKRVYWLSGLIIVMCGMYLCTSFLTEAYFCWFAPLLFLFTWQTSTTKKRGIIIIFSCILSTTAAAAVTQPSLWELVAHPYTVRHILGVITALVLIAISFITYQYTAYRLSKTSL